MNYYGILSIIFAILLCLPFFIWFERGKKSSKELALIAVMTAVCSVSRLIFFATPGFKPIASMVIFAGVYLGCGSGFIIGAMSALISNFFFGQGPWTPFQMLAFGFLGLLAGIFGKNKLIRECSIKVWLIFSVCFGILGGFLYSCVVDIWTVLAFSGGFDFALYLGFLITALPFTIKYCVSNVVFLIILRKPICQKLQRVLKRL